jgi:hypothetical protein
MRHACKISNINSRSFLIFYPNMPNQDTQIKTRPNNGKFFGHILRYAAVSILSVFSTYFYSFHSGLSKDTSSWGDFGDFVGGTLSPILTFVSIIALVHTIELQRQQLQIARKELKNSKIELRLTRQELEKSAKAQAVTALVLQKQAEYALITTRLSVLRTELDMYQAFPDDATPLTDREPASKRQEVIEEIMGSINEFYCEHKNGLAEENSSETS